MPDAARGITEQEPAAEALRESEKRFRALFDSSPDAVLFTIPDGQVLAANPAACAMFGMSEEEICRVGRQGLSDPDDSRFPALLLERRRTGRITKAELSFVRKNGEQFPAEVDSVVLPGDPPRSFVIMRDITRRLKTEGEFRDINGRLRLATASAKAGVWDWNLQTDKMIWNDRMFELYGISQSNFSGTVEAWKQGLHPEDSSRAIQDCQAALNGERDFDTEFRLRRPDGSAIHIKANGLVVHDEAGNPLRMIGLNTDITERKQAEEALLESSRLNRQIIDSVHEGIIVYGTDLRYQVWNPFMEELFGLKSNEVLGKQPLKVFPFMKETGVIEQLERALSGEIPDGVEYRYALNGNTGWVFDKSSPLRNDAGEIIGVIASVQEITQRKVVEETRSFLLRCGTTAKDEDFFALLAGYLAKTLGMEYVCIDHLENDGLTAQTVAVYNAGQLEPNVRYALKDTPCGEVVDKAVCCYPRGVRQSFPRDAALHELMAESYVGAILWDSQKRPIGLIAVIGNHELKDPKLPELLLQLVAPRAAFELERRKTEKELRDREFFFRESQRAALIGSYRVDFIRDVWESSEVLDQIFGIDETYNRSVQAWLDLIHPDDKGMMDEYLTGEVISKRNPFRKEYRIIRKSDGQVKWVFGQGEIACDDQERVLSLIGTIQDVTDRKEEEAERETLQAQLSQAQKMESVGRLAGGVAHDFNNMLQSIFFNTGLILEYLPPGSPLCENVEEIQNCAQRSADITRQLLAFARKQTAEPRVLDLNAKVEGMLQMMRRLIGEDIHLTWAPASVVWPVRLDPIQIDQILVNLCVNARDAIAGVGKLTLETENFTFDEMYCATHSGSAPGDYVLIGVSDNGCGMDKEVLEHLFEPFFTTKGPGQGTGLGLATVYGIVQQYQGFIDVQSEPGHGTTFRIYLPKHKGKADELSRAVSAKIAERGHETILVVEDEPAILKISSQVLQSLGYTVLPAATPGEAIRLAEEHAAEIHLLMTDVIMPEMNGRDLAKQLRSLYPHLQRLFMSGYTADVIAHHGMLDEGVHFIQKPFSLGDLAAKVRSTLDAS